MENLTLSDSIMKECNSTKYYNGFLPRDSICATAQSKNNVCSVSYL